MIKMFILFLFFKFLVLNQSRKIIKNHFNNNKKIARFKEIGINMS